MGLIIHIESVSGAAVGRRFTVEGPEPVLFGRSKDCQKGELPREDNTVSRKHFAVQVRSDRAWIWDLGSSHGTFVNGQPCPGKEGNERVQPGKELHDGDLIRAGETTFKAVFQRTPVRPSQPPPFPLRRKTSRSRSARPRSSPPAAVDPQPDAPRRRPSSPSPEPASPGGERGFHLLTPEPGCSRASPQPERAADAPETPLGGGLCLRARHGPPVIDGVEIRKKLEHHGLGASFLCCRPSDARLTVIKVVRSATRVSPRMLSLLEAALQRIRALQHHNILKVAHYGIADFGEDGLGLCVEMEYCPAGNVERAAEDNGGRLPFHEVYSIMVGSLSGLAHAHSLGIVHGNLKPSNLLLAEAAGPTACKLADFSLRPVLERILVRPETSRGYYSEGLPFRAPEQLTRTGLLSAAADVWGIGAVFYYLLTGQYPRRADAMAAGRATPVPARVVPIRDRFKAVARAQEGLLDLVDRALAESPGQRFRDAGEMLQCLKLLAKPVAVVVR